MVADPVSVRRNWRSGVLPLDVQAVVVWLIWLVAAWSWVACAGLA
jgi:hypothetical protein